jgi:hypothetical protein
MPQKVALCPTEDRQLPGKVCDWGCCPPLASVSPSAQWEQPRYNNIFIRHREGAGPRSSEPRAGGKAGAWNRWVPAAPLPSHPPRVGLGARQALPSPRGWHTCEVGGLAAPALLTPAVLHWCWHIQLAACNFGRKSTFSSFSQASIGWTSCVPQCSGGRTPSTAWQKQPCTRPGGAPAGKKE